MSNPDTKGTDTVFIGCKIPQGVILEIGSPGDDKYVRIELQGAARSMTGVGITEVRKDHWDAWLAFKGGNDCLSPKNARRELNRELPFIKKGHVFDCADRTSVEAVAIERQGLVTGFEGLDPLRPVKGVEPVDAKALRQQLGGRVGGPGRVAV